MWYRNFGAIFQCPSCHRYCIIDYQIIKGPDHTIGYDNPGKTKLVEYNYNFIHPWIPFNDYVFNKISKISKDFKDIYIQAAKAESLGLNQIYIMGYRKALEYLVVGYLINFQKEKKSDIEGNMLGKNISKITDRSLVNTSRITSWIGNDGTHIKPLNPKLKDLKNSLTSFVMLVLSKIVANDDGKYIDKKHFKK